MSVNAELLFAEKTIEKPRYIIRPYGVASVREGSFAHYKVEINDARKLAANAKLDSHGFQLINEATRVFDFDDEEKITSTYYNEIKHIVARETGALAVHVIDHNIRNSKIEPGVRGIATHAHNDYTEASCREKLRNHLGKRKAKNFLNRRVIELNAWRPLMEPVLVAPLAVADGSSIPFDDLIPCDLVYPERIGEIYELSFSKKTSLVLLSENAP